jgi:ATP-dependent DNA helicase DinG
MSIQKDLNKFKPRKEQDDCLKFINEQYNKNKSNKIFLLDLPVGVGKSHLAMMISQWYSDNVNRMGKTDIITNTKILQDQYSRTYKSIQDLKGKENYECSEYGCSCAQGAEFNRLNKTKCEYCPHSDARESFFNGKVSLTNFYLYTLYALYMPQFLDSRESSILIVDEAHAFDDVVSNFISVKVTETTIKRLKFKNQKALISKLKGVNKMSEYINFLEGLLTDIDKTIGSTSGVLKYKDRNQYQDKRELKIGKILGKESSDDVKKMKLVSDLGQLKSKIEVFLKEYKDNPNNWVMESTWNDKSKRKELSLEPIWASDYLDKYVFSRYDMVFLMSGTILDKNLFCELNGLDPTTSVYYSINSPFSIKNRPIYYMPLGKMSYKVKAVTFKKYIPIIKKILKKYEGKKGLIHTNSFELANWISRDVKDPRLIFHDSSNKDEVLLKHYETEKPTVIVSPSMDTGVSFDDDRARFQVIAKIPYPSLTSQKNKMRQKMREDWYMWKTVSGVIQMSGRVVRSDIDHADTIIIDAGFSDVIKYSSHLFPNWFQVAIKKVNVKVEA